MRISSLYLESATTGIESRQYQIRNIAQANTWVYTFALQIDFLETHIDFIRLSPFRHGAVCNKSPHVLLNIHVVPAFFDFQSHIYTNHPSIGYVVLVAVCWELRSSCALVGRKHTKSVWLEYFIHLRDMQVATFFGFHGGNKGIGRWPENGIVYIYILCDIGVFAPIFDWATIINLDLFRLCAKTFGIV